MYQSLKLALSYLFHNRSLKVFTIPKIEAMGFYSQIGQDIILNELFCPALSNGFYIDIGAHNGKTFSNSYHFERSGWDGMCIEGNPRLIFELQQNRDCEVLPSVISDVDGECDFLSVSGNSEMLSTPKFNSNHRNLKRIFKNIKKTGGTVDQVKVVSSTLAKVLLERNIKNVDFISVDVEGSELNVLRGFDFDKVNVKLFIIENNYFDFRVFSLFYGKNYKLLFSQGSDEYYASEDFYKSIAHKLSTIYLDVRGRTWISRFFHKLFNSIWSILSLKNYNYGRYHR
jgi:FkbM family methyltransferase